MVSQTISNKLELPSQPDSVNTVEKLIDEIRDKQGVCEDVYGNMLVAVTEAVNNAIFHGNKGDTSKTVHLLVTSANNLVSFIISDEGAGFDYYNIPDPTTPENIEKPCGRGIFLMRHLSDQLIFSDNGRTVELHFRLQP